jgi:hypothetical protein
MRVQRAVVLLIKGWVGAFALIFVFSILPSASATVVTFDSINIAGDRSTSTNYVLEDTIGEISTGYAESGSFDLHAGFQQVHIPFIAMTPLANVIMDNEIAGISGGSSNGFATTTVVTDSPAGYELSIQASTAPALTFDAHSFADYDPGETPSFAFTVSPNASAFGFTPEGDDVVLKYRDNGSSCNTGSQNTAFSCWNGITSLAQEWRYFPDLEITAEVSFVESVCAGAPFAQAAIDWVPSRAPERTTTLIMELKSDRD